MKNPMIQSFHFECVSVLKITRLKILHRKTNNRSIVEINIGRLNKEINSNILKMHSRDCNVKLNLSYSYKAVFNIRIKGMDFIAK